MLRGCKWCGALALVIAGLATPGAGAQRNLLSSLARYEVTHGGRREHMEVMRTSDRIEHRYATRGITEVWTRDGRGDLSHWKVFHQPKRSVHYTAGDLRTIHLEPTWEQLGTLINPLERSRLRPVGTRRTRHGVVTVLQGAVDGLRTRILWDEERGWAGEMVIGSGPNRTRFRMLSAETCSASLCEPLDASAIREVEFADLGDSEGDPFVRNFLATFAAHSHSHSH